MPTTYGATPAEWDSLSLLLGLTSDLLPVVSNPEASIDPFSKLKSLGKVPSRYNARGHVVGIAGWTSHVATTTDVARWREEPDYGICLQTRTVRAIDIDVEHADTVQSIIECIGGQLNWLGLPTRTRDNSNKCLLVFQCPGDLPKRVIRLDGGIIELLGTGQQFIACGTHTSGVKYEWLGGLPDSIPSLTLEEVDALWHALETQFAIAPSSTSTSPSKAVKLTAALENDSVAQYLIANNHVKATERDGRLHITCPFEAEHTTVSADSATTYFPANTGGYSQGHFDCRHAHCEHRTDDDFKAALGMPYQDPLDDFDVVPSQVIEVPVESDQTDTPKRFQVISAAQFAAVKPQTWIVKKFLPRAELGVVYGESGSGKTFFVLDLVWSIIMGEDWRGLRVEKGRVAYICAEGAGGMRSRLRAYSQHTGVPLDGLGLGIIPDSPNFMLAPDVKAVLAAIRAFGEVSVIVVDTFAQVMAGANENAGEDVGKALAHCKALHRKTGALVLLVHHSGKDASKGARGWSGLRAACDVEIEIVRCGDDRAATLTKLKDGQDGLEFGFKLAPVCIGHDDEGDDLISCVVEPSEVKTSRVKVKPLGVNEQLALRCLRDMTPLNDEGVAYDELVKGTTELMPPVQQGEGRDRRFDRAKAALKLLLSKGEIVNKNGFVFLPESETE